MEKEIRLILDNQFHIMRCILYGEVPMFRESLHERIELTNQYLTKEKVKLLNTKDLPSRTHDALKEKSEVEE